jgi:phage/plasmid-like protein (TIGR03299 family)
MITSIDKVAFAETGAWHNLGEVVPADMDPADAVKTYLNWKAEEQAIYIQTPRGFEKVESHKAIVRSDERNVLGVVGADYSPIQHESMVEDIKALCGESGAKVHTIGSLMGGKRVWILLKTQETSKIGNDKTQNYIALMSSHDGSLAYVVTPTTVRIVCNNTLTAALRATGGPNGMGGIRIKHTANATGAIQNARKVLGNVKIGWSEFETVANALAGRKVPDNFADFVFNKLYPGDTGQAKTAREKLVQAYKDPRGGLTSSVSGTAFGVFNAVTEYVDYLANVRKTGGRDESTARAESSLTGAGGRKRADAWDIINACVADKELSAMLDNGALKPDSATPILDTLLV